MRARCYDCGELELVRLVGTDTQFRKITECKLFVSLVCALVFLSGCAKQDVAIERVIDGDTLVTTTSLTVRLLQIDTPELSENECYAEEAKSELIAILESNREIATGMSKELRTFDGIYLEQDPVSDSKDKYGRKLAYVIKGKMNVNLELVKRGAAAPYFYNGEKGKYAQELITAAEQAKQEKLGVWGACPSAVLDPTSAFSSGSTAVAVDSDQSNLTILPNSGGNCDPNYEGCVPMFPPDLDCPDIRALGLAPVHRIAGDPHKLDRDGDGVGCE